MTNDSTVMAVGVQVRMAVKDYITSVKHAQKRGSSSFPAISNGILGSLCCPHMSSGRNSSLGRSYRVPEINAFKMGSARECIPGLLVTAVSVLPAQVSRMGSLLAGLNRARCWDACLASDDAAYALAAALCHFSETVDDQQNLDAMTTPDALSLLNQWVNPQTPWVALPGPLEIAQSLFGLAWCEIVYPGAQRANAGAGLTSDDNLICYAISRQRPPFMPGRYPAQDHIGALSLPSLEMAP